MNALHQYITFIENGTRCLAGAGNKVTLSFYARSSIANKRIVPNIRQSYGSGGSPTTIETILGTPITLSSTWTKYTVTFTLNTLVGKTFGTNYDDSLLVQFWLMWGTTYGNTYVSAGVTQETYLGSGTIDFAQIQLCAGDVALPFEPRSFQEELQLCQRYYCSNYNYGDFPGASGACEKNSCVGRAINTQDIDAYNWTYPVRMRTGTPTNKVYGYDGTIDKVCGVDGTTNYGGTITFSRRGDQMVARVHSSTAVFTAGNWYWWVWTADAGF